MKALLILLLLIIITMATQAQPSNDTTAIKQLLEKESAIWRAGDVQAHADCWHIQPYSRILVSTPERKIIRHSACCNGEPVCRFYG